VSDKTEERLMKGVRKRQEESDTKAWRTLPEDAQPYAGWVYSTCNLRGHPADAHWHPPVGQTPFSAEGAESR
jgi:hypothetical protein